PMMSMTARRSVRSVVFPLVRRFGSEDPECRSRDEMALIAETNASIAVSWPMLDQIDGPIASFTADGAYDQDGVYSAVAARHPEAAVIVPPRSNAVPSETAETAPTPRDRHLQAIAEHGRMSWQKTAGYNWRALVEADIGRWKRVIGHALRSQTEKRQATEVALAVDVLNRMLALGRPSYVRIV